jgi:hypothetical protein
MAEKKLFKFANRTESVMKPKDRSVRAKKIPNTEDLPPYYIRGIQADSKDEWWVSLALERIEAETGWTWKYQVPVYGGRSRGSGGNVVDFLIHTPGRWTILDPMGRYWHTGKNEDQSQMINVARRKNWILIAWFTDETPTRERTYTFLRDKLNV